MPIKNKGVSTVLDSLLRSRIETMKTKRALWEDLFEEAYSYALPQRENFDQRTPGTERNENYTYDSTAMIGVQDLAANLQSAIVPAKSQWAILEPAEEVAEEQKLEASKFLQETTNTIFKHIHGSNLDNEIGESFQDLAISTGAIAIEDTGDRNDPVNATAIPADELLFEQGSKGTVDNVFREYKMTCRNLVVNYPGCSLQRKQQAKGKQAEDEVTVMEGVIKNEETGMFEFYSIDWDKNYVMKYAEMKTSPYIVFRWGKNPGERWGRGPVIRALPFIRSLNRLVKLELQAAAFAVNGVYVLNTDHGLPGRNFKIEPGSIVALRSGQKLETLNVNTQLQVSQITGDQLRSDIKMALYSDRLPPADKSPHTATEISIRQAEFHRVIGPAFGRLTNELVEPLIKRYLDILQGHGIIKEFKLDAKLINIKVQSPITQNTADLDKIQQLMTGLTGVLAPFGEAGLKAIGDEIDLTKLPRLIAEKLGVDLSIFRTNEEKEELQGQQGEQQAEAELIGGAKEVSEIAKNLQGIDPNSLPPMPPME